jgi:hypothetical protein
MCSIHKVRKLLCICEIGDDHSVECPISVFFCCKAVQSSRTVSNQLAASISRVSDVMASLSRW